MANTLKKGDKVYWRMRAGMYYRTLSGRIKSIKDDIAVVEVHTQNIYGKNYNKHINDLTKCDKQ
jgi:hypothetical protein